MRLIGGLAAASLLAISGCSTGADVEPAPLAMGAGRCASVHAAMLGASTASATWIEADAESGLPAFCEVTATLSSVEGSKIGVVYRLPEQWNGRMLGLGGGGFAGNVSLFAAREGLLAGYATAQTDGGHPETDVWYNGWASNPASVDDFSWRAVHEMTVSGKALIASYYGEPHERAYFQGCSTGGRMALMEAQRFPDDYDAISAGAPVYTLQVQTSAIMRSNLFRRPGAGLTAEQLGLVNRAVLKACDANDGLADGIINDPRACDWDPGELVCKSGQEAGSCISPGQAEALRTAYAGIRAPDGEWAMLPLARGGEPGWIPFIAADGAELAPGNTGGIMTLGGPLLGDSAFDFANFTAADATRARASQFARAYEAKNPDLSAFAQAGGKLLIWHGENDQAPSTVATADYVDDAYSRDPSIHESVRYFPLPAVPHCRGGPGADDLGLLEALDEWMDSGKAPEALVATRGGEITRKVCAWPKVARFTGGAANDPDSWECVNRGS